MDPKHNSVSLFSTPQCKCFCSKSSSTSKIYHFASGLSGTRKTAALNSGPASKLSGLRYELTDKNLWLYSIKLAWKNLLLYGLRYAVCAFLFSSPLFSSDSLEEDSRLNAWILENVETLCAMANNNLTKAVIEKKKFPPVKIYKDKNLLKKYEAVAQNGNDDTMILLASAYHFGKYDAPDLQKALEWYEKAAELDNLAGLLASGLMHQFGYSTPMDTDKAIDFFSIAAEKGDPLGTRAQACAVTLSLKESRPAKIQDILWLDDGEITQSKQNFEEGGKKIIGSDDAAFSHQNTQKQTLQTEQEYEISSTAQLYEKGSELIEAKQDPEKGMEYLKQASREGNTQASSRLAEIYRGEETGTKNLIKSREFLFEGAKFGDSQAMLEIANCFLYGMHGFPKSTEQAKEWYEKAAEEGNAEAAVALGAFYAGIQDFKNSVKWYEIAAKSGDSGAQYLLGMQFLSGYGTYPDAQKAFHWFLQSASQKHREAQYRVGQMYLDGQGVSQDLALAWKWLSAAALKNHPQAQFHLGVMFAKGEGVVRNQVKASYWYEKAAIQGHKDAQVLLGSIYLDGDGLEQDVEKGLKWLSMAALQGDKTVQMLLAKIYLNGRFVSTDMIQAYAWFSVLNAQDIDVSAKLEEIRSAMNPQEIKTAEQISLEYWHQIYAHRL